MNDAEKAYQYFLIAVPENEEQAKAYFWARKALQPTLTPPNEPLPVLVNDEPDREYIDYICPRCKNTISQRRRGQRMETVYKCKFHDNCGQRVDWSDPQPYRRPPEEKKNASPDLISRSALLRGETEPEITTGSDSELAEHMEWERWMDKIKRAPAVDKEEEP